VRYVDRDDALGANGCVQSADGTFHSGAHTATVAYFSNFADRFGRPEH
jgi:hypothetical protein